MCSWYLFLHTPLFFFFFLSFSFNYMHRALPCLTGLNAAHNSLPLLIGISMEHEIKGHLLGYSQVSHILFLFSVISRLEVPMKLLSPFNVTFHRSPLLSLFWNAISSITVLLRFHLLKGLKHFFLNFGML